jgi:CBS domain-containing protein
MLLVKDVMNKSPITIYHDATLREAAILFVTNKISDLMVLDNHNNFKGVVSVGDLIRYMLPNYDDVILSTVHTREQAGELFFQSGRERMNESFAPLIIDDPIMLSPDEQLFSAAIIMAVKQIHTLPIVHRAHLLGTLSRGELCLAILQQGPEPHL